jgi:tetratricopeptide (TPR) repeat protein
MSRISNQTDCQASSEQRYAVHPIFDLCSAKRFDEALQLCRDELAQKPDDPASYRHMADVLELAQRHKEALPFRDKVLELAPNSAASYFSRGDLFYQTGNYPAAIQDFSKAAKLDGHGALSPLAHLYRADCHRRLKAYDEAIADAGLCRMTIIFRASSGNAWAASNIFLPRSLANAQRADYASDRTVNFFPTGTTHPRASDCL